MSDILSQISQDRKRMKTETISQTVTKSKLINMEYFRSLSTRKDQIQHSKLPKIYKNCQINEEDDETGPTQVADLTRSYDFKLPHHKKKQMKQVEKIYDLLCNKNQSEEMITICIKPEKHDSQIYSKVQQYYAQMKCSKKTKDVQEIFNLISYLKIVNCLFTKLDEVLSMVLFKKGKVVEYEENTYVYHQNEVTNNMLIILWGEVKIKDIFRKKVKYCFPGEMLCEEIVWEGKDGMKRFFSQIGVIKGAYVTRESAKTLTKCGFLELNKQIYDEIRTRFIENSQKDKILIFDRMVNCSLVKKAKLRK